MSDWLPASAVITGGASGIGLAVARELSERGVRVMLADLPGASLDEAAAALDGAVAHPCDVADLAQVEALADAAFAQFGSVELLLNNAGVGGPQGKLWEIDPADARAHFDINYWGVWNGCKAFTPRMVEQDAPSAIYNTASENSFFCAGPRMGTYIAAKHAVLGLTESFREDLPAHVHAGVVIPGWVHTPIGPEQFMSLGMDSGEFAKIIVPQMLGRERFVVSHYSNFRRIRERIDPLLDSYERHASREQGDTAYDVRDVIDALRRQRD
ncbi:SDR family NAD(P)-dependent oxidoreductase [Altererythrobacter arenosus]|uniref:SDR family NAD(P)-dependent oxidoreductase n=1 Tax=Altererythrobacter arenosus TaxID=3032592 RepID=A0ABY8FNG9_9SPHN|nr:SDR family NAD(P)-dependent oxidoreductase [Altererythrobacter sp. CAU 1644]WFL76556.1 SDR family NAD(P)-dependent oxidoreductase [Altererythrobacter sp. CAU 1644]